MKRVVISKKFSHNDLRVLSIHIGGVSLWPVVKLTGLGSLCLSKSLGVPRMCVGAVSRSLVR